MKQQQMMQVPMMMVSPQMDRQEGKSARKLNFEAAIAISNLVKSTLGPKGIDKLIVNGQGDVIVTNDGVTILREVMIEHPISKMVAGVAETQEREVGDGTTTAVVLVGELLKRAEKLLDQKIHPTVVVEGFNLAKNKSLELLNEICEDTTNKPFEAYRMVADTAMTGKASESDKNHLISVLLTAIDKITSKSDKFNRKDIKVETIVGESIQDTTYFEGIVLPKEKVINDMPDKLSNPRILILGTPLEPTSGQMDASVQITLPEMVQEFAKAESTELEGMAKKIIDLGATAVFSLKSINDRVANVLSNNGIIAAERVLPDDLLRLQKCTGAKLVTNLEGATSSDLGLADNVEYKIHGDTDKMFYVSSKNSTKGTILLRGGSDHVLKELKRAYDDAIGVIHALFVSPKAVYGAGSCEFRLRNGLKEYALKLDGRLQLVVEYYADAIQALIEAIAENSGLDPINSISSMSSLHKEGNYNTGLEGAVILEPLKVKSQAIISSTELANMILRIDDVLVSRKE